MPRFTSFAALHASNNPDLTLGGARAALGAAANALAERDETINRLIRKEPYATVATVETVEMVQESAAEHDRAAISDAPLPAVHDGETVKPAEPWVA